MADLRQHAQPDARQLAQQLREIHDWNLNGALGIITLSQSADELERLAGLVDTLQEALRPFALLAELEWTPRPEPSEVCNVKLRWEQIVRAREAFADFSVVVGGGH